MPRKKKMSDDLVVYRLDEQAKVLNSINDSVKALRKDVLEQAIPEIDKKVENLKGKTAAWAMVISLFAGGGVSIAIAMLR